MRYIGGFILATLLMAPQGGTLYGQTSQQEVVNKFGDIMSIWCDSGNDELRSLLDDITQGEMGCRVDDGIMEIFVSRDQTGLLTKGSTPIDNYLNEFTKAIENGVKYSHGQPVWEQGLEEPTAFSDKTDIPLYFISMPVSTKGDLDFKGTSLFFVRGGQITKIEDFNDTNSLSKALALYSAHKNEEAFNLFRKLAYAHPDNYEAQYYTAVMEIKKHGCKSLNSKVRDMEAAWWIVRAITGSSPQWIKERMSKLYYKFSIDETLLPFNNFGKGFYLESLERFQLVSEGLMPYKKNGKYGYMDENGRLVVPCIYSIAYPFDKKGHALVGKDGKYGYIDRNGKEVIPVRYKSAPAAIRGGRTMVILDDELLLLDEKGNVLKKIGKNYSNILNSWIDDTVYAYNDGAKLYHRINLKGEVVSEEKDPFSLDLVNHCFFIKGKDGRRLTNESYGW